LLRHLHTVGIRQQRASHFTVIAGPKKQNQKKENSKETMSAMKK
jgi:hypothetical protein